MNEKLELLVVVFAVIAAFLMTIYGRNKSHKQVHTNCCKVEAKEEIVLTKEKRKVSPKAKTVKQEPLIDKKPKPKRKYKPRAKKKAEVEV